MPGLLVFLPAVWTEAERPWRRSRGLERLRATSRHSLHSPGCGQLVAPATGIRSAGSSSWQRREGETREKMETQVQSHHSAKSLEKNLSPISLFKKFLIKPFVFAVISSSCRPRIFQALPARGSRAGVSVQQKVITHCAEFTAPVRDVFWGCFSDYFTESSRKPDLTRVPAPPRPAPSGAPRGGENLFSREGSAAYSAPTQQVIEWAQAAVWFPVSEEGMNPSPRAVSGGSRTRGPQLLRQDELWCGRRLPAAGSGMGETGENPRAEAAVTSCGVRLVPPL